jgi:hypothetical protein
MSPSQAYCIPCGEVQTPCHSGAAHLPTLTEKRISHATSPSYGVTLTLLPWKGSNLLAGKWSGGDYHGKDTAFEAGP